MNTKKCLAQAITLGLLMAAPFSAFAGDDIAIEKIDKGGIIGLRDNNSVIESVKVVSSESVAIGIASYAKGESFVVGSKDKDINVDVTGALQASGITADEGKLTINANNLVVTTKQTNEAKDQQWGIFVLNRTEFDQVPEDAATLIINANKIVVNSETNGIAAYSNGQMEINGSLEVNAPLAVVARGNSTIDINKNGTGTVVLNGDIAFETPGSSAHSGNIINANININMSNSESVWKGNLIKDYPNDNSGKEEFTKTNDKGFALELSNGATWTPTPVTESKGEDNTVEQASINNLTSNGGVINLENAGAVAKVDNLKGDALTANVTKLDGGATLEVGTNENKNITVAGTAAVTDEIGSNTSEGLQKLADKVKIANGEKKKSITSAESTVVGALSAETDENGAIVANTIKEEVNQSNKAISNMNAISLMSWRAENNDMNKRLGELRDSNGEHGVWVRMTRGEGKYSSIKTQYNAYQLGYDEKLSTNEHWTVGGALTYTDADNTFEQGKGDEKHKGFALYGSYLGDDGSFVDLIAKYAHMENNFNVAGGVGDVDYNTNGYSMSAEYGKRFTQDSGFYVEPQVELTYGTVGSVSYDGANNSKVRQDKLDSVVGRVGVAVGKNISKGNVYLRGSYLYDFDGETRVSMTDAAGNTRKFEQDLGGGWFEVGVGTNINFSKATHLYFDVEKTFGGDVATPWQWNAGLRYSF